MGKRVPKKYEKAKYALHELFIPGKAGLIINQFK